MRFGNWVAMFVERFEVEDHRFADQCFHFGFCICGGDATGQIRDVGGVAIVGFFDEDGIFHSDSPLSIPASLRILDHVLGARSLLILSAIVTVPGFSEWRYCL